jgi:hypothetical protein
MNPDAFAALIAILTIVLGIAGYLLKKRIDLYDLHLRECEKRAVITGRSDERLERVETEVTWLGNCMIDVCVALGVKPPPKG